MEIKQRCKECGEFFNIDEKEQLWYKEKGFSLPRRCYSCRSLRRKNVIGREDIDYGKKKDFRR